MKKLMLLPVLLLVLASCSSDDNGPTLYGKWYHVNKRVDGSNYAYASGECGRDYMQFYGKNKVRDVDNSFCDNDANWEGTFERDGNTITVNVEGHITTIEILELTDTEFSFGYFYDIDGDGILNSFVEEMHK